jgi:hypothetical protein
MSHPRGNTAVATAATVAARVAHRHGHGRRSCTQQRRAESAEQHGWGCTPACRAHKRRHQPSHRCSKDRAAHIIVIVIVDWRHGTIAHQPRPRTTRWRRRCARRRLPPNSPHVFKVRPHFFDAAAAAAARVCPISMMAASCGTSEGECRQRREQSATVSASTTELTASWGAHNNTRVHAIIEEHGRRLYLSLSFCARFGSRCRCRCRIPVGKP